MQQAVKVQEQSQDSFTLVKKPSSLTLSYDLENYHTLLTHIAQDDDPRWVLFIAPPGKPNATLLQQAGINKSRIICVPQSKVTDHVELLKTALSSDNYATVITWLKGCDEEEQSEISKLCAETNSKCFVYCTQ